MIALSAPILGGPLGAAAGKILADALGAAEPTPAAVNAVLTGQGSIRRSRSRPRRRPRANGSRRWPRSARRKSARSAQPSALRSRPRTSFSAGGDRSTRWNCRWWNPAFAATLLHGLWIGHEAGINGFASLSAMLMTYFRARFGVLGVYINGHSREKQALAAGESPPSLLRDMVKTVVKKK